MKTASIRELHEKTGRLVRQAQTEKILITDRGRVIAVLKSAETQDWPGKPFPKRALADLPKVRFDSTVYLCEERERF